MQTILSQLMGISAQKPVQRKIGNLLVNRRKTDEKLRKNYMNLKKKKNYLLIKFYLQ